MCLHVHTHPYGPPPIDAILNTATTEIGCAHTHIWTGTTHVHIPTCTCTHACTHTHTRMYIEVICDINWGARDAWSSDACRAPQLMSCN